MAGSFGMTFSWGESTNCGPSKSPPMTLYNVTSDAVYIEIRLINLTSKEQRGKALGKLSGRMHFNYGDLSSEGYKGPCNDGKNIYLLEARLLDRAGETIAVSSGSLPFPE